MPVVLPMADTMCISDVPGFVKQTSTPLFIRVCNMLSAPFINSLLKMQCASIPNFRLNIVPSFQLVNFANQQLQINQADQHHNSVS
jgi:hypothetical protein